MRFALVITSKGILFLALVLPAMSFFVGRKEKPDDPKKIFVLFLVKVVWTIRIFLGLVKQRRRKWPHELKLGC